jgi:retron-type reverse transcriptase
MEDGEWSKSNVGSPQGAVISSLLANIYLHYVLDEWVYDFKLKACGEVHFVRYAELGRFVFLLGRTWMKTVEEVRRLE